MTKRNTYRLFIPIGILLMLFVATLIMRHEIVGHTLSVSISKKTDKKITLQVDSVDFQFLSSTILLKKVKLLFDSLELNKNNTLQLQSLQFEEIKMSGISLLRLLLFREINAKSLEIKSPSSFLSSENTTDTTQVKPKEIVEKLNSNKNLFGKLVINIDHIIIQKGRFQLEKQINGLHSSLELNYGVKFFNFNTKEALFSDSTRFIFSSEIQVKLDSINYINAFGDAITSDSINFTSRSTRLGIFGLQLIPSEKNNHSNSIAGHVKHLEVDGTLPESLEDIFDIELKAVKIEQAQFILHKGQLEKNPTQTTKGSFVNSIGSLRLNEMSISKSNLIIIDQLTDTIAYINIKLLDLQNLIADSGFIENPETITLGDLSLNTEEVYFKHPANMIEFRLNSSTFNENAGLFTISDLTIKDLIPRQSRSFDLKIQEAKLKGLYLMQLLKKTPSSLSAHLQSPHFYLHEELTEGHHPKDKKPFNLPKNITLASIGIQNGYINWIKEESLSIEVKSIDLYTGRFNFKGMSHLETLQFDSLSLNTGEVLLSMKKDSAKIHGKGFSLNNRYAEFKQLKINMEGYDDLTIKRLQIENPNLKSIAMGKQPHVGLITFYTPRFAGKLDLRKHTRQNNIGESGINGLKHYFTTEGLVIKGGKLNTQLILEHDTLNLKTDLGIRIRKFSVGNKMDKVWLSNLRGSVTLSQTQLHHQLGSASFESLNFNNLTSKFTVNNLDFNDHRLASNSVTLNELRIKSLTMGEIDYKELILNQSLQFGIFWVNNPQVDIEISKNITKNAATDKKSRKTIQLQDLPFSFREIGFENMQLNLIQVDSNQSAHISMDKVDFRILHNGVQSTNLTDHLELTVNRLSYSDQHKEHSLLINKLQFKPQNNQLEISGIAGEHRQTPSASDTMTLLMSYNLNEIDVNGFAVSNTIPADLSIRKIQLKNTTVKYHIPPGQRVSQSDKNTKINKINLPSSIQHLLVDTLLLSDLSYHHDQWADSGAIQTKLIHLNLSVNAIQIDTTGISTDHFSFVESTHIEMGKNHFISSDSLYTTNIASLGFDFKTKTLTLDSLKLTPRYADPEFFEKAVYQTDRVNIFAKKIVFHDLRLSKLIKTGLIHFGGIDIYGLNAHLYRDKHYPMDLNAYKKMPQEMILDIKRPFLVDSIKTHNAEIHYKEITEKAKEPGHIFFDHFDLTLRNLTNIEKNLLVDSVVSAELKTKIMGRSDFALHLFIDMKRPGQQFWFSGHSETIAFDILNPVTQNLVGVDMQGGKGRVLIPMINGDSIHTTGTVLFLYKKLKVGLYNREKARSTTGLAKGLANLLLNDMLIRSNNPAFFRKAKTGVVYTDRITEKSFVNYLWKSILSGMVSTFGINTREQRQEKRVMKPLTD